MSEEYDITGGLDLLGDWLDAKGYTEEAGLCTRAMDEINRLKEEYEQALQMCMNQARTLKRWSDMNDELRAENAKLREALRPFADMAKRYDNKIHVGVFFMIDECRAARKAIGEE